jgi:hypothetical protein
MPQQKLQQRVFRPSLREKLARLLRVHLEIVQCLEYRRWRALSLAVAPVDQVDEVDVDRANRLVEIE